MTKALSLVMPMAGRGSRFSRQGFAEPKPLVPLHDKPFFEWAVESVTSKIAVDELVFVVLREHVEQFGIDRRIAARYRKARIVVLDEVTSGAAETAAAGIAAVDGTGPIAINDCDHAFDATGMDMLLPALRAGSLVGALVGFRSASPAFSYVELDPRGRVTGTVEKQPASPFAIAGCYLFGDKSVFHDHYARYRETCAYDELFMSGIYNLMIASGGRVGFHELRKHVPFGTPEEMAAVEAGSLEAVVRQQVAG